MPSVSVGRTVEKSCFIFLSVTESGQKRSNKWSLILGSAVVGVSKNNPSYNYLFYDIFLSRYIMRILWRIYENLGVLVNSNIRHCLQCVKTKVA